MIHNGSLCQNAHLKVRRVGFHCRSNKNAENFRRVLNLYVICCACDLKAIEQVFASKRYFIVGSFNFWGILQRSVALVRTAVIRLRSAVL